jgi:putative PIN family toxin of toxin-antitoxin system
VPKLKVLLDTNVIISALYVGGKPLRILELAESGDIEIFLSPFILNEIQQVLMGKLGWENNKVRSVIAHLESLAEIVRLKHDLKENF